MGAISLLTKDPAAFLLLAVLLLYSIIAHEVAHGWVAKLFGDRTAENEGRLTANPLPHIDPIGLLMLFLVGFGWARPVPINYAVLRQSSRWAPAAVSLAGVTANFLIACAAVAVFQLLITPQESAVSAALGTAIRINIALAAFNLIPIPPLDGSRVVAEFLPLRLRLPFFRIERFGFFILIILLYTGALRPVIRLMENFVYRAIGLVLSPLF